MMKALLAYIIVGLAKLFGIKTEIIGLTESREEKLGTQMDDIHDMVAFIVGIKNGLVNEGFPEDIATEMTKDIIASAGRNF